MWFFLFFFGFAIWVFFDAKKRCMKNPVLEAVGDIQRKVAYLPTRAEFNELKQDVKTIKAAVTATNRDLKEHKSLPAHAAHGRA